jgi:hypothetical protein
VYRGKWIVSSSTGQIQWLKTTIVPMSVHKIYFAILIHSSAVVAIWGKCFQQVWNEKFIMFIYTQKFHIFFFFLDQFLFFFSPQISFVQSWAQFLPMPYGCFEWSGKQLMRNEIKEINTWFNHKSVSERKYLPDPQTTKTNRPKSHGPTGEESSLDF